MTDQQRHDDPVRDHAVFSRHEGFFSKPSSDAARCMQDHDLTLDTKKTNTGTYRHRFVS